MASWSSLPTPDHELYLLQPSMKPQDEPRPADPGQCSGLRRTTATRELSRLGDLDISSHRMSSISVKSSSDKKGKPGLHRKGSPAAKTNETNKTATPAENTSSRPIRGSLTRQSSIKFAPLDDVVEIPHINDFTEDEIERTWITSSEKRASRSEWKRIISIMDEAKEITACTTSEELMSICPRGLEAYTPQAALKRQMATRKAQDAVFQLQDYEKRTGKSVAKTMALLLRQNSATLQMEAQETALRDADAARSPIKQRKHHKVKC